MLCGVLLFSTSARAQTVDLDQLLAVLAEVIQDRAKQVAADTVKRRLAAELCGKSLVLQTTSLHLGRPACLASKASCTADDIYVNTCRAMTVAGTGGLTNVQFLKTVAADTVSVAVRLAAISLSAERFHAEGLDAFGPALYRVGELLTKPTATDDDLAEVLFGLADSLETNQQKAMLERLGAHPATAALLASTRTAVPSVMTPDACDDWRAQAPQRAARFEEFAKDPKHLDGCSDEDCWNKQLELRLGDLLRKLRCPIGDPRATYRQLGYVVSEANLYDKAFAEKKSEASLTPFVDAVRANVSPLVPRDELSTGVRLIAASLRARVQKPDQLETFFATLDADADRALSAGSLDPLRQSKALDWANRNTWEGPVRVVRDTMKDLLAQPRLVIALQLKPVSGVSSKQLQERAEAVRLIADLVHSLRQMAAARREKEPLGAKVARVLRTLSHVIGALTPAKNDQGTVDALEEALTLGADVVELAESRQWVGLALSVAMALERHRSAEAPQQLVGTLRFVQMLMSVYQATSPEEAKSLFTAALQDLSARRERYDGFTIDVGALVAVRGGAQLNSAGTTMPAAATEFVGGVFAPVGLQLASGCLGVLLYPFDLGSYLVGRSGGEAPKPFAALRFGGSLFLRPSADLPLVAGVGSDYHPAFDGYPDVRLFGFLALELPLFTLY